MVEALATVGLDAALATRRIDQLSGGQMRRVVLAGLLARSPRALILDEPLAGLDAASQRGLLRLLEDLRRNAGLTVVVISHDFSGLEELCPRTLHLQDGVLAAGADGGGRRVMTAPTRRPARKPVVLLRPVPGRTVIHDLWAGTKLIVVAGIGVLLTFYPGWVPIAAVAALVLATARMARIPRGALPSIPRWLWFLLLLGGVTAALGRRQSRHRRLRARSRPRRTAQLPAHHRAVDRAARARRHGVVDHQRRRDRARRREIGQAAAPAAGAGRRLGGRTGARAARVSDADRRVPHSRTRRAACGPSRCITRRRDRRRRWALEIIDLLAAAVTVALRRADEMGDAITARGGSGQISAAPSGPKRRDWVALSIVALVCGAALALELTLLGTS